MESSYCQQVETFFGLELTAAWPLTLWPAPPPLVCIMVYIKFLVTSLLTILLLDYPGILNNVTEFYLPSSLSPFTSKHIS